MDEKGYMVVEEKRIILLAFGESRVISCDSFRWCLPNTGEKS